MATGLVFVVSVPNFENLRDEVIEQVRTALDKAGGTWSFRPFAEGTDVLELVSSPMGAAELGWVAEGLIKAKVQYAAKDISDEYTHVATLAPKSYDYAQDIEMFVTKTEDGRDERHLLIKNDQVGYRRDRYSSGLHASRVVKE